MENKTQQDLWNVLQTAETEWLMGMNHRKTHTSQTPSFHFTLFRADFSWLFHCTKHLFMLKGMFMLISCSSSCRSCYEWSKKAAASKQKPQEASMHPQKTCFWLGFYLLLFSRFVFTEMSKTSLTRGPAFCTVICLPGLKLDNKKVTIPTKLLSLVQSSSETYQCKGFWHENTWLKNCTKFIKGTEFMS